MTADEKSPWLVALNGLAAAIGGVSAIVGIVNQSVVDGLNVLGIIGVATLTIGGGTYFSSGSDGLARIRNTVIVSAITAAVAGVLYLAGRPLDSSERGFNLLTVIGVLTILFGAVALAMVSQEYKKAKRPPMKTCPDCANEVLLAARKCQYCSYEFAGRS